MRILLAVLLTVCTVSVCDAADAWSRTSSKDAPVSLTVGNAVNPFGGFYAGVDIGGQFTNITITDPHTDNELVDGLGGDGLVYGGNVGFNIAAGRFVFGPYVRAGFSSVSSEILGLEVSMDNYIQTGALVGIQLGNSSLVSFRVGYEWSQWEASGGGDKIEADVSGLVFGGGIETLLAPQVSLGLDVDYVTFTNIEADGIGDLSEILDKSDALRVTLGLKYRPQLALPSLEKLNF